jgi:hypothetical protein
MIDRWSLAETSCRNRVMAQAKVTFTSAPGGQMEMSGARGPVVCQAPLGGVRLVAVRVQVTNVNMMAIEATCQN